MTKRSLLPKIVFALLLPTVVTTAVQAAPLAMAGMQAAGYVLPPDVRPERSFVLQDGLVYERYQQFFGEARVFGGQVTLYRDREGVVTAVVGAHYPDLLPVNRVGLSRAQALAVVERHIGRLPERRAALMLDPGSGRYFYRIESRRPDSRWVYWVDAGSGVIMNSFDALMTECEGGMTAPCGQGAHHDFPDAILTDVKDLSGLTAPAGGGFQLSSARVVTHDQGSTRRPFLGPVAVDDNDEWAREGRESPGQGALVDAHFYVTQADRYFNSRFGFDLGDDAGHPMPLEVHAHYTKNYVNAFWNGSYLAFGDGDGVDYDELTSLDVAVHEFTHAVTEYTSGLIYQGESGALNESFSDIMATSAELEFFPEPGAGDCVFVGEVLCPDWLIGEDFDRSGDTVPGFRNMADPEEDGLGIDHYSERYTGSSDNGGVHWNSAVSNHAYYLLAQPAGAVPRRNASCASKSDHASAHCDDGADTQDNNLAVTGIGLPAAEQIFFLGFIGLNADASMCDARAATEAIAVAKFGSGSQQARSTTDAWVAVGLTDAVCAGSGPGPVDAPPSVAILSPENGVSVAGLVVVQISASDELDTADTLDVGLLIDGIRYPAIYKVENGQHEYDWDTSGLAEGSEHVLIARVTDSAGNSVESPATSVRMQGLVPSGTGVHVSDLDASSISNGGTWSAEILVEVQDAGELVTGAVVEGTWSLSGSGPIRVDCVTGTSGRCLIGNEGIKKRDGQVTFSVTAINADSGYEPTLNDDPDGDSDGTSITVSKP